MKKAKLSCAIIAALSAPYVSAEDDNKNQLEVIEVTASKRTESIQDVPVAVTALSGENLKNLGISSFQDYIEFLPNVTFQGTGPGQNEVYIRGAATTQTGIAVSSVQALQPSVAIYLDEQPISMQGRNLDVYATDLQRVEVLPGPQGTLFGASSQAGTVRLITNKPDHSDFSAGVDIDFSTTKGGDNSNAVEAYINLPITEDFAFRVAAYSDYQGGWIDNVRSVPGQGGYIGSAVHIDRISGGVLADPANTPVESPTNDELVEDDYNDATYAGARFSFSYLINDDWSLLVQHTAQTLETEGVFAYDPSYEGESSVSRFEPESNEDEFGLTTWTLEGRLNQLEIVYAGGYLDRKIDSTIDYIGYTNGGAFAAYYACTYGGAPEDEICHNPEGFYKENTENKRVTHELRFNTPAEKDWRVTAGVFYDSLEVNSLGLFQLGAEAKFNNLNRTLNGGRDGQFEGINSSGSNFGPLVSFVNDVTHEVNQIAAFGQFEYDLTDKLTVSLGARWYEVEDIYLGATTSDDVTERIRAFGQGGQAILDQFGQEEGSSILAAIESGQLETDLLDDNGVLKVNDTIFRFSIDYKLNKDVLLFANYSEGFRPPVTARTGGNLARNQTAGSAFENFRIPVYSLTDTLDNYELGLKGDFFDSILRFNATAYYSDIKDLQTSRFDPTNIAFFYFTDNVGEAEIKGLDIDFTWLATDNLVISGALSLLDTEITRLNSTLVNLAPPVGSSLPYSADVSGNLRARYYHEMENGMEGFINASISYTGDRLSGMFSNANIYEDTHQLVYGTGSGLEIEQEIAPGQFQGVNYTDRNGNAFGGGRYVAQGYVLANLSFGVTKDDWRVELYIDNLTDKSAQLYIDEQQFTPKVVTNRPRTIGLRMSYDFL
ncbi:TonB-dependent receptor [Endozoicomonas sp. G2_1]|uniref:TonB-dependent receptor n=1 Tax=Endozoicomonas sp. G2_1 TaxID=2821091 RepID=UPI001ADC4EB2|nr:TonB-dependent receptor [Endozoicomonas sp. G2_1]MBO9490039.1 TonB-dependent receptor [Endozoicomonas sp. G2_1]